MKKGKVAKIMKKRILLIIVLLIVLIITIICRNIDNNNRIELSTEIQKNLTSNEEEEIESWTTSQQGSGWEYITSITETSDGGVIGVGSISSYSDSGADVDGDDDSDETSLGDNDGLIVNYDEEGTLNWSATFGGENEDELNKVDLTSDGGFVIVGFTSSYDVYYDGTLISELSIDSDDKSLRDKDGILIKISSSGSYEWGVRIGGTYDDEITSVIETSDGNIAITGTYYSNTFNFYDSGDLSNTQDSITKTATADNKMNGFVASYTSSGDYDWSQNINGSYDVEVVDITETTEGIAIAVNHISTVYLDTNNTTSQSGASTSYVNGTVVGYDLDGTYSWRYRFYPSSSSYNTEITSISVGKDDDIFVGVNHGYILYGQPNGDTAKTLYSATTSYYAASVINLSNDGESAQTVLTIDATYDDYISDVFGTYDGGVLISGWFYSTSSFTVGDYTFSAITGTYTSDGFVIKLNEEGDVEYANQYAGDGYDTVETVTETNDGKYFVGGSTTSSSLGKTEITSTTDTSPTTIVTSSGNADGFISYLYSEEATFYTITVNYYLGTDENKTALTDSDNYSYVSGYKYTIIPSSEINTNVYELIKTDGTTSGTLTTNITINYYYEEITVSVEITKISGDTNSIMSGVTFSLFELTCEDETHTHDDLIDVDDDETTCWELVETYTTDENGIFILDEIPISGIYRLVETKTINNYLLPSGQWEIEFDYGNLEDDDLIDYNGQGIKITAIENPPAFSLQSAEDDSEEDILYLYNYKSYNLPFTGLTGVTEFYYIAFALLLMGVFMMMYSKKRKIHVNKNSSRARHGSNRMKFFNISKIKNTRRRNRRHSK